jgi:hypothetical protein
VKELLYLRFDILMAVKMLIVVLWVVMPYDLEVVTDVLEECIASIFRVVVCILEISGSNLDHNTYKIQ